MLQNIFIQGDKELVDYEIIGNEGNPAAVSISVHEGQGSDVRNPYSHPLSVACFFP
jgi:hypothetical protein